MSVVVAHAVAEKAESGTLTDEIFFLLLSLKKVTKELVQSQRTAKMRPAWVRCDSGCERQ